MLIHTDRHNSAAPSRRNMTPVEEDEAREPGDGETELGARRGGVSSSVAGEGTSGSSERPLSRQPQGVAASPDTGSTQWPQM
jgi:hypothetical protein